MRWLLFISRLALLCNICFLICIIIQRTHDFIGIETVNSYIISLGWFVSPFLNLFATIYLIVGLLRKKNTLPIWLAITNALFLLLQFFVHFII